MRSSDRSIRLGCSASSRARMASTRHRMRHVRLQACARHAGAATRRRPAAVGGALGGGRRRLGQQPAERWRASARSSWRCTTMSTMPWSRRYSALWKPVGQLLADGLLDHARAGEADQRAGLGDVHVAEHRVGGGDAAGGRIGQHDDVGQPRLAQPLHRDRGARHLHQREDALLHARAAGAANRMNGVPLARPRSRRPLITASPAAMPSEPPMKSKSCTPIDDRQALELAVAELDRVVRCRSWRGRP